MLAGDSVDKQHKSETFILCLADVTLVIIIIIIIIIIIYLFIYLL